MDGVQQCLGNRDASNEPMNKRRMEKKLREKYSVRFDNVNASERSIVKKLRTPGRRRLFTFPQFNVQCLRTTTHES